MTRIRVGLDKTATETQQSEGWCYFCIPERKNTDFKIDLATLLSRTTKLISFRGKKFKADQATEYEDFIRIVRYYTENSAPTILNCTLYSKNWIQQFRGYSEGVIEGIPKKVGITDKDSLEEEKSACHEIPFCLRWLGGALFVKTAPFDPWQKRLLISLSPGEACRMNDYPQKPKNSGEEIEIIEKK
jgi:hypothetical protein